MANVGEILKVLFGKDLMFTNDLKVGKSGDYLTWDENEALRQAIYRRLMTAPGEFAVRPEYGVGVRFYVKRRMGKATLDELRQRIEDQLAKEDRIERVIEAKVEAAQFGNSTGVKIYVKVQALGQEQRFSFDVKEG
jgi:phage baseplate assembly protein W